MLQNVTIQYRRNIGLESIFDDEPINLFIKKLISFHCYFRNLLGCNLDHVNLESKRWKIDLIGLQFGSCEFGKQKMENRPYVFILEFRDYPIYL